MHVRAISQRWFWMGTFFWLCLAVGMSVSQEKQSDEAFGFIGPEVFPIDNLISILRAADVNGDGLNDLVVANNRRSKISILYNRSGDEPEDAEAKWGGTFTANQLPPDARFRIESVASEKRIFGMAIADFNGDSLPDLAYYGTPQELVLQFNGGANGWGEIERYAVKDGLLTPNGMTTGDLNGDLRDDLLLLAEGKLYVFYQAESGGLEEAVSIPYTGEVKSVQALDVNGDQLDDLLFVNWEHAYPFRFRLQIEPGKLGPEYQFEFLPIRSYWADDLDADRRTEVITIARNSGRAQISNFELEAASPFSKGLQIGQFEVLPMKRDSLGSRGSTWGDVNGDGLMDLVISEPSYGEVTVFLQAEGGRLAPAVSFPSLSGVTSIECVSWDGEGADVFVLSGEERQIGRSSFTAQGRLTFPDPVELQGRPLVMASGHLKAADFEGHGLVVITNDEGVRRLLVLDETGVRHSQALDEEFRTNPTSVSVLDVNQDGFNDVAVLIPYEAIKLLVSDGKGGFFEDDLTAPGGDSERPWMGSADIDGDGLPEILLSKDNFVRAMVVEESGDATDRQAEGDVRFRFRVKEQINGAASSSRIVGASAVRDPISGEDYIFLLDEARSALGLCKPDASGVWKVFKSISLPFVDGTLRTITLGQTSDVALAMMGRNAIGRLRLSGDVWALRERDSYETPIEQGHLLDVVSGDLNNDNRKDLVFLEVARHYVDIVAYEEPHALKPSTRWQVFETKTFRATQNQAVVPEPREAVVGDFTGDGINDLVLLVHDRLLLYPQE